MAGENFLVYMIPMESMEKAAYLEAVAGKGVLSGSSLVNICRALWSWKGLSRRDLYFVLGLLGFEQWV